MRSTILGALLTAATLVPATPATAVPASIDGAATRHYYRVLANHQHDGLANAHPCKRDIGSYGDPTYCLRRGPWERIDSEFADALAESSYPNADRKDWSRRCVVNYQAQVIACLGGKVFRP